MGIALAHHPEVVNGVELSPLVAGDDARRNAQRAHQHHEGGGDVFTKPLLAIKPEFIGAVGAEHAGLQGVDVASGAQTVQHHADEGAGIGLRCLPAHLSGQLPGARVETGGQGHVVLQAGDRPQRAVAKLRIALRRVAHEVIHRGTGQPLQLVRHPGRKTRQFRWLGGGIQHQQPRPLVRLQRHLVAQGGAADLQIGLGLKLP